MSERQVALVRAVSGAIVAHLDSTVPELAAHIGAVGCLDAALRIMQIAAGLPVNAAIDNLIETLRTWRAAEVATRAAAEPSPAAAPPGEPAPRMLFRFTLGELADIVHAHVQKTGGLPDISTVFAELRLTPDGVEYTCQALPNVTVLTPRSRRP